MRQREIFLDAYTQFRAFDRSTLCLIEPLRGLRMVHYAAWLARRYHDPIFQQTWPEFGSEAYWQRETEDLESQLNVAQRAAAPPGTLPAEPEEALTNKDFFWDWDESTP